MAQEEKNRSVGAFYCKDCLYFYVDERENVYRREPCYFCKRKGPFYSRSFRIGEGTRITQEDKACPFFLMKERKVEPK